MTHPYLEITSDKALQTIKKFNGLAKTVRSSSIDSRNWDYLLDQLDDPATVRPVKPISAVLNRNRIFNAASSSWSSRDVSGSVRGASKKTKFTKKSSHSLLPPNGKMKLFSHGLGDDVGLLFDMEQCLIKPQYIFQNNINSDSKPWLQRKNAQENVPLKSITLEALRLNISTTIATQEYCDTHNEILAKESREALVGVFATKNTLLGRVAALAMQQRIFEKLNVKVPALIITPVEGVMVYTQEMQREDIAKIQLLPFLSSERQYLSKLPLSKEALASNIAVKKPLDSAIKNKIFKGDLAVTDRILRTGIMNFDDAQDWLKNIINIPVLEKWTIFTDVNRQSGEESYYDKKKIKEVNLSGLSILMLTNSNVQLPVTFKGITKAMLEKASFELHKLRALFVQHSPPTYYWEYSVVKSSEGLACSPKIIDTALRSLLQLSRQFEVSYSLQDKKFIRQDYLDKINTIKSADEIDVVQQQLQADNIVNYRRYGFFDKLLGRFQQATNTREIIDKALSQQAKVVLTTAFQVLIPKQNNSY